MAIFNVWAEVEPSIPQILLCLTIPKVIKLRQALVAVGYLAFRLSHDPLRKYPGPLVARLTSGYGAFYVWRRCLHLVAARIHDKYGPVVRLAPNRLVFNSSAAIQDIYNNPRATKGQAYLQLRRSPDGPPTVFTSLTREDHKAKSGMIAPILNESSMRRFEPDMSRHIDCFLLELLRSSRQGEVVNASDRCERLSFDIMGLLAFSYEMNTQGDATHRELIKGIKARVHRIYTIAGAYKSIRTIMAARMKLHQDDAKRDFYALASKQVSASHKPGSIAQDIWAEAIFFIAAGGGTVSTAMSGILFYLSRNAEAYSRLASEIRTTFTSRPESGPQLISCKYLRAVIEETMRMSPSTLEYMWRQQEQASVAAGESFVVDGHVIPPGTQVAISQYSMQHNETLFPEPFKFKPERWLSPEDGSGLTESAEQRAARIAMRRAFAPFSIGERACSGQAMAWLEMRVTISRILWYFDFKRAGELGAGSLGRTDGRGRVDEYQLYYGVVLDHSGPDLVFTTRGDYWKELQERANA